MAIYEEMTPALIADTTVGERNSDLWVVDANLPAETLAYLATEARAAKRPVAALTVSPAKAERLIPLLDQLTYLFANRREAAFSTAMKRTMRAPPRCGSPPNWPGRA